MIATLRIPLKTIAAALVLAGFGLLTIAAAEAASARREPNGAIRFYDDYGQDRGYAWCLKRAGRWFSGWSDCSYFTYGQCRAAIIAPPGGDCEPNPFAAYVTEPPAKRRVRR